MSHEWRLRARGELLTRLGEEENEYDGELETKTLDIKREVMITGALEEIRATNARMERKDYAGVLETLLEVKNERCQRGNKRRGLGKRRKGHFRRKMASGAGRWIVCRVPAANGLSFQSLRRQSIERN